MSRKRAAVARTARGARSSDGHTAPNVANAADTAAGVLGRSAARAGLAVPLYLEALQAGAMARLEDSRAGQLLRHDLNRLLLAAERLGLDPLGGEIYAAPGGPGSVGPALLVLSVDGWCRVLNAHPAYEGIEFREGPELPGQPPGAEAGAPGECLPAWVECTLHRRDRRVPTSVREYMAETRTDSPAWQSHPRRMLRHKALVQCARVAFGLAGLYDPDEALRVQHAQGTAVAIGTPPGHARADHPRPRAGPVGTVELKAALCRA